MSLAACRAVMSRGVVRHAGWLAVAAVMVVGVALRAAWHREGYTHPDEVIAYEVVGRMRHTGDWETNWARVPNLADNLRYDQYNFSSYHLALSGFFQLVKWLPGTTDWVAAESGFLVYRFASVFLGIVVVWQTWRLARLSGGPLVALVAATLAAVSVQLVQDAHYVRPEAFVTVLTLAAVAACRPEERDRPWRGLSGAWLIGLLIASKVSMVLLVWLPLVAWVSAGLRGGALLRRAGAGTVALGVGFACGAPGAIRDPQAFVAGIRQLMSQYGGLHPPHSHPDGRWVADLLGGYYAGTLGWFLIAMALVGGVAMYRQRRRAELLLLAGPVAIFGAYFATRSVFFERNLSHVVPLFLILAAVGVGAVANGIDRRVGGARWWWVGVAWVALVVPSVRLTWPLVTDVFSGRDAQRREAVEATVRAGCAGCPWKELGLFPEQTFAEITAHFAAGGAPLVLKVNDYGDAWSAANLRLIATRLEAAPVAEFPSPFGGLPVCTLQVYSGPHTRYYRLTGVRR